MDILLSVPVAAYTAEAAAEAAVPFWLHFIERFFVILTAAVVAFGVLHVELELLHWLWSRLKGRRGVSEGARLEEEKSSQIRVKRFDGHQRLQHILMFSSFIVLALTGIPQKFYQWSPFEGIVAAVGGLDTLRLVHRIAGGVMIVDGVYHLLYLVPGMMVFRKGMFSLKVGSWIEMIPTPKDFMDFFRTAGYLLGRVPTPPEFGRFSYLEKFDYWAVFWGMVIMGASGIFMLLPALGLWVPQTTIVAAALASHSDEAILAVGWIVIVHLYHAHLAPRVFPFNTTIFTGKISLKLLKEEHYAEYVRYQKRQAKAGESGNSGIDQTTLTISSTPASRIDNSTRIE